MFMEVGYFALMVIMVCIAILLVRFIYMSRWMANAVEEYTEYTDDDFSSVTPDTFEVVESMEE